MRGEVGSLISGRRLSAGSPPRLRNFDHIRNPQPIGDQRNRISKLRQRQDPLGQRTAQSCSAASSIYIDFTLTAKARSQVASSVSNDIAERMDGGGAHQDIKRAEPRDGSFYRRADEIGLTRVAVKAHYDLLFICHEKIGDGEGVLRMADDGDLVAASGQERRRRQSRCQNFRPIRTPFCLRIPYQERVRSFVAPRSGRCGRSPAARQHGLA